MRKRPDAQLLTGRGPELGQSVGFHNQEEHDERTKNHVLEIGRRGSGQRQAQPVGHLVEQQRQQSQLS